MRDRLPARLWPCDGFRQVTGTAPPNAKPANAPAAAPVTVASDADLAKTGVNEAGQVPILEYHNIRVWKTAYDRTPQDFRNDLERLYREGYRPIALHDYLDNRIDVPLGMTPCVLTFDNSSPTQFRYKEDRSLDPDCAFGILKAFNQAHPDFAMKAVFYMNASPTGSPSPVLGSRQLREEGEGVACRRHGNREPYRIHPSLKKLSDAAVQKELADCVAGVHKLAPEAVVDTLALPFGASPKNKKLAEAGEADGVAYHNRAVLLVGANPAPAPCSKKFNPLRLPRIQAYSGVMGSEEWLNTFRDHPKRRYISDGDPATVTIPKSAEEKIDPSRLGSAKLRTY